MEGFLAANAAAFGGRAPQLRREWFEPHIQLDRLLVSRDGGEIVGSAASESSFMTLPGLHRAATGVVVTVSVAPSHRRQGRLNALMRCQLDDLHDRGEALATLFASEGTIYGRYGYGMATFGTRYELDKKLAKLEEGAADLAPGRILLIDRSRAVECFPEVYGRYAPTRAGEIDRRVLDYARAVGEPGENLSTFHAVYEEGGHIDGYVGYEVEMVPESDPRARRVVVHELCHLTTAAYVGLWRFLLGIDLVNMIRAPGRPVDEPIRWLLTDPRQLRAVFTGDRSWLCLVDVKSALAARG